MSKGVKMSLQTAEQFEENEQYNEAYEEYKKLYEKNPKDLSLLERLGHIAMLLNKNEDAAQYYSKILEADATNILAYEQLMDIYVTSDKYKYYVYRGNLHSVEHKFEHAINDYKKAVNAAQNEKDMLSARFVLATLLEQEDQNLKAIDEYLKVIEYGNTHEEVYLKLAALYLKENASASAIDVLERAKKDGFKSVNINEMLSDLYLKTGKPEKALENSSDELTKVRCLLELNKIDEAFAKLKQMESQYNHIDQFHSLKAQYYFTKNEFDKALECVEEFNKVSPNSPLTFQMRALIYENKNDDYQAHLNWGKYNLIRNNKDVAINEFLNAFQLKGDDINLLNTLAVLLEETGDKNHAIEFYEKISMLDINDKKALEKLAQFRESIGDYRTQAEYLEKLYQLDNKNSLVIKNLAKVYERLRNKNKAVEFYNKYLELGNSEVYDIRKKLEKLTNSDMQEDDGLLEKCINWFNNRFKS